jgi:hypothetical protein
MQKNGGGSIPSEQIGGRHVSPGTRIEVRILCAAVNFPAIVVLRQFSNRSGGGNLRVQTDARNEEGSHKQNGAHGADNDFHVNPEPHEVKECRGVGPQIFTIHDLAKERAAGEADG